MNDWTSWSMRMAAVALLFGAMTPQAGWAQDGGGLPQLDESMDALPLEASRTAVALHQLKSRDGQRVAFALYELEGLLALPGLRRKAVTDVLKNEDANGALQSATAYVKGKSLRELHADIVAVVRQRVAGAAR